MGTPLIACRDCDLLLSELPLQPRQTAYCSRCGSALYRTTIHGLDRSLAFSLAACVLLVLANVLPIASLDVGGQHTETTLWGAAVALYRQDMVIVATLVVITTIVAPAIELATMLYMLIPLKAGVVPSRLALAFRMAPLAREWGLIDVFMLGVVVSLIKLNNLAVVVPGIALWSFGGLIVLLTATGASFNPRELWARAKDAEREAAARHGRQSMSPR
jgi:paraquat-inducible protein A